MGREDTPSLGIIDSRSIKSSNHMDSDRSIDGNKKIKEQKLIDDARTKLGAYFKVVLRPDESLKKFSVLPLRWIVERSFSWLENFRRIAMDYEYYSETRVAMVQLAFCRLMYNKIND